MGSIGVSTMDQAVARQAEQQYYASQLNMLKHQSRLSKASTEQEQQRRQIQQQTLASGNTGKLDYNFGKADYNKNQQAGGVEDTTEEPETEEAMTDDPATNLKQAQRLAKKQQATKGKTSKMEKIASPIRNLTSSALRMCWKYLIPSWGLTIIGINLHGFFGLIFGHSMFCKYGHEWADQMKGLGGQDAQAAQALKGMGDRLGWLERSGVVLLDLLFIALILLVAAILTTIVMALEKPVWAAWGFIQWLYSLITI